jgi:tetratricopeptide (TPR) repeat protein
MENLENPSGRIDTEIAEQKARVTSLALACALATIASAAWYMWPALDGDAVLFNRLGAVGLLLSASLLLQDLAEPDARARGRLGAVSSLAWPALAVLGVEVMITNGTVQIGHGLMFIVAGACLLQSREFLRGNIDAQRFRGIMTLGGTTIGGALMLSSQFEQEPMVVACAILGLGLISSAIDLFGGDDDRSERKRFGRTLDSLELRILKLQARGVSLDQASSLCRNASEIGYKDPELGFRILEEAEEDIERTLALAEDISEIRDVCAATVAEASEIAPTAKKPQRSMDAGDRERDLGSLREAEMLYRRAKKLALNINEHWNAAEEQIIESSKLIAGLEGSQYQQLHELLIQAKEALAKEDCVLALEISSTIPDHVSNLGEASEGAEEAYEEAVKIMEESEGLDLKLWNDRLESGAKHLEKGEFSLARGVSDGIVREVRKEREAMSDVQRALRQKKKIKERWKGRLDTEDWEERLKEVTTASKRKSWSHAAALLDRLTSDLDVLDAASGDAEELVNYVQEEWSGLRKKLEAAGIKAIDGERAACEKAVGDAKATFEEGRLQETLSSLGEADALMEKLRRRV